ncbi:MAG: hypothetical protein JWO91_3865 [Acidobacteriaceae bacterium]|nr:hypothetical protein [Acidobacteriaceae bacterium]
MGLTARTFSFCLLSAVCFAQHVRTQCDSTKRLPENCASSTRIQFRQIIASDGSATPNSNVTTQRLGLPATLQTIGPKATSSTLGFTPSIVTPQPTRKQGFHWRRALLESFTFFSIEQAYVIKDDFRWVVSENGVPFNHYWRDYKQSLSTWVHAGWNDGDPALYSYVGHPIQGALTSYIQIQNDPKGERLEFSNTREYWRSRIKATLWNAVYSTQWNIGPLSELTFEKYGTRARPPWNQNGTWPCTAKHCFTGVGQVDLVTTPVGGLGWLLAEDLLDKHIARRVERSTRNRFLIDVTRCALNPIRGGANILHGKRPWYRDSRDAGDESFRD